MARDFYAPKPLNLLGRNDRLDMLLDMGVSPGDDESYETQARRLYAQKDRLIDNKKLNMLQKIEIAIQNARNQKSPEGPLSPLQFVGETLAKSIPSPSEVDIDKISRSIPEIGQAISQVVQHPIAAAKQAALNFPPEPTTVASMFAPGVALKAYRELAPLEARTYLHHMAGIPTPFTHVNERERAALTEMAQHKIDKLLETQTHIDKVTAMNLKRVNDIKLMTPMELIKYAEDEGYTRGHLKELKTMPINKLREVLISDYKRARPSTFKVIKRDLLDLVDEADSENVRKEFKKITGKQLRGFGIFPGYKDLKLPTALGKTYIEPMIEKETGRIVPKAIKDTYKFYPDVYHFKEGQGRQGLKEAFEAYIKGHFQGGGNILNIGDALDNFRRDVFSMDSLSPLGIWARKLGFTRPTSIIDIPLQAPAPMNAYDKAAILLGAKAAAQKKE